MNEDAIRILRSFGLDRELDLYLQMFQKARASRFAIIKLSGGTLEAKMEVVADDLAFLSKMGLTPIVIHGGGKQIDRQLKAKGIRTRKVEGLRVTDRKTMRVVERTEESLTARLVKLINEGGGRAINANGLKLITAESVGRVGGVDLGFAGKVKGANIESMARLCDKGYMPVLASLGHKDGAAYNINADTLGSWLVRKIRPKKFILVTETGGVLDKHGDLISTIDIDADLQRLISQDVVTGGMLLKVREIGALLKSVPQTVVEVCSAESLLQELFTIKGKGTFIRYTGNFIVKEDFAGLNTARMRKVIERSISKKLVKGYFKKPIDCVIVDRDYTGIMIVKRIGGVPYLDKFAVARSSQGSGLGTTMWHVMRKRYSRMIWRASASNPAISWYFRNCDGMERCGQWIIFWYNLDRGAAARLIPKVAARELTLV